jgi:Flp pilus assembly protein TadD
MRPLLVLAALAAFALAGCAPARKPETAAANPQMRSQALIDSGNVAFKAKDFEGAAKRYASAAAVQPDDPAAYYGLGMALSRLGRDEEAREAYAKARALMGRSGDSIPASH